ncbi:hypothetical protein MGSAQ_003231, partial [marine sediment metagenome]
GQGGGRQISRKRLQNIYTNKYVSTTGATPPMKR